MNNSIIHCENEFEYARSVSKKTLEIINNKLKQSDVCNVAVSGGSSPLPVYDYLANNKGSFDTDWSKVNFFFIDERCVSKNDIENNFINCEMTLLNKLESVNAYRMKSWIDPHEAAIEYEKIILSKVGNNGGIPQFDLIFMGIGEDGHVASLFEDDVKMDFKGKLVINLYIKHLKMQRITMTLDLLNNPLFRIFAVIGNKKKNIFWEAYKSKNFKYPFEYLLHSKKSTDIWYLL